MLSLMVVVFILGYLIIALEHPFKINKAATALILGVLMWGMYTLGAESFLTNSGPGAAGFKAYLAAHAQDASLPLGSQFINYIMSFQIVEIVGELSQTIFFLLAAMTIVEIIDKFGGFLFITSIVRSTKRVHLLWLFCIITFFLSAILDNLTTTIVMIALIRKLVGDRHDRWFFAGMVVVAANAGGAWSPIGDVTTIMLWVKGNVTTVKIITRLIIPSLVSMLVPLIILSFKLKGNVTPPDSGAQSNALAIQLPNVREGERKFLFIYALLSLMMVPVLKATLHLPPFLGMLFGLGVIWLFTEIIYMRNPTKDNARFRVPNIMKNVDMGTILFFLGILLAVGALQASGLLGMLSEVMDRDIHNVYVIDLVIGVLSSIVDNVPLVAGAMGMHEILTPGMLQTLPDQAYMASFVADGTFWELLAYCAGTGGSLLIIGSAAGVAAMGLEKIDFMWYLKNISLYALIGYLSGFFFYVIFF